MLNVSYIVAICIRFVFILFLGHTDCGDVYCYHFSFRNHWQWRLQWYHTCWSLLHTKPFAASRRYWLRSTGSAVYVLPRTRTRFWEHCFFYSGLATLNTLPSDLYDISDTSTFRRRLKECTFWLCLPLTIVGAPGHVVQRHPTNSMLIDWLIRQSAYKLSPWLWDWRNIQNSRPTYKSMLQSIEWLTCHQHAVCSAAVPTRNVKFWDGM